MKKLTTVQRFLKFLNHIISRGKQGWLTEQIPKTYLATGQLLELVLYQSLIYFFDEQDGDYLMQQRIRDWKETDQVDQEIFLKLQQAYNWAKYYRRVELAHLERLGKEMLEEKWSTDKLNDYATAERVFIAKDTAHMQHIIEQRYLLYPVPRDLVDRESFNLSPVTLEE